MRRLAWMASGVALASAAAVAAWSQVTALGLDEVPAAAAIFVLVAALLSFYVGAFALHAAVAAAQIARTNRRLAGLATGLGAKTAEPAALYATLVGPWFVGFAECYIQGLRPGARGDRWRGRDPADAFPAPAILQDPLLADFFGRFAQIFVALTLIALLMGCVAIIDDGLTSVTAMTELRATLLSSAVALGAAAITCLAHPLLLAVPSAQLRRFVLRLRMLFATDDGALQLRAFAAGLDSLRSEVASLTARLADEPGPVRGRPAWMPRRRSAAVAIKF